MALTRAPGKYEQVEDDLESSLATLDAILEDEPKHQPQLKRYFLSPDAFHEIWKLKSLLHETKFSGVTEGYLHE